MRQFLRKIADLVMLAFCMTFYTALVFGGFAGAIYWAYQDDLLAVVGSLMIPMFGFIYMLIDILF